MKEFDDIQALWKNQTAAPKATAVEAMQKSVASLKSLKRKHLTQSILFFATAIALIFINEITAQKIEISVSGFYILMGCSLAFASAKLWLYKKITNINLSKDSLSLLKELKNYKKVDQFMMREGQVMYSIILSIGVYLYLSPLLVIEKNIVIVALTAYCVWAVVFTFFIKAKEARKEAQRMDEIINNLM